MGKIQAVGYSEIGEYAIHCILSPEINGEEYVKNLNSKIEEYNKDVEVLNAKESELRKIHKYDATFEEVTGAERLNEREPKYPHDIPKGMKNHQTAYPEIAKERERRSLHNEKYMKIYNDFMTNALEQINLEMIPLKKELMEKWPEFKPWIRSESYSRTIYCKFHLEEYNYVSKDTE